MGSYALSGTLYSDQQGFNINVLGGALTITPVLLNASIINNPSKVYDGTTTATLNATYYSLTGFVADEGATVNQSIGTYNSKDVPTANTVTATLAQSNYVANANTLLSNYQFPSTAVGSGLITPATLVYTATPTTGLHAFFTGTVTGFITNENVQNATTGSAYFYTLANKNSPAGRYPILGAGLDAQNYVFVQAPENATALTLDNSINYIFSSLFTGINIDNFDSVSDAISSSSTDADKSVADVGYQPSSNPLFSFLFESDDGIVNLR